MAAWGRPMHPPTQPQQQQSAVVPVKANVRVDGKQQPRNGIQCVRFSPGKSANYLSSISWDSMLLVWNVGVAKEERTRLITPAVGSAQLASPALDLVWRSDAKMLFVGACDNRAYGYVLQNSQLVPVAQHDAPIRRVRYIAEHNTLITGSWDATVRFWDLRQPMRSVKTIPCRERIYCMDTSYPFLATCTAGNPGILSLYDIRQADRPVEEAMCPLKTQIKSLAVFPKVAIDKSGVVLGSVGGRVVVRYNGGSPKEFSFKCHRDAQNRIYPVNDICFHPHGTFATCGSDGVYNFWDKDSQQRLRSHGPVGLPVTSLSVNGSGSWMAYSVSYDWHRGRQPPQGTTAENYIFLHPLTTKDVNPRTPAQRTSGYYY